MADVKEIIKEKESEEEILDLTNEVSRGNLDNEIVSDHKLGNLFPSPKSASHGMKSSNNLGSTLYVGSETVIKDGIIEADRIVVVGKILDVESIRVSALQILDGVKF